MTLHAEDVIGLVSRVDQRSWLSFRFLFHYYVNVTLTSKKYKSPPLALAVIEIRHPEAALSRGEVTALAVRLRAVAPIQQDDEQMEFPVQFGPAGAVGGQAKSRAVHRFLSRDKRTSISYSSAAISIESTNYQGWEWFSELLVAAVTSRQDIAPLVGYERIGLRYINEIRVSGTSVEGWRDWVSEGLLAPTLEDQEEPISLQQQQSVVQYGLRQQAETLTLRYGAVHGDPAVGSTPSLVRKDMPGPGVFFLIDLDAAWSLSAGDSMPDVDLESITDVANELHSPISRLFESLITDRLREVVFEHA